MNKISALIIGIGVLFMNQAVFAASEAFQDSIYQVGSLKPIDSIPKLKVGDTAPDFELPAVAGGTVKLSDYRDKKNVVISFVPAAWTPVCSDQWPGYNIIEDLFAGHNAILLGISVDNIPTLYAWTGKMGKLWFPVLSDFWPHGAVADSYGVLRSNGTAERAIFIIDTKGIIRYINVNDINRRPPLDEIMAALKKLNP
jgi:peroxiredoxin (alkyl hydroperoxide reductase subunit C)